VSADLRDLKRLKISDQTRAWLTAEAHRTGRSKQEIARDALHEIALEKIHAAKVLMAMVADEAPVGDIGDHSRDSQGRRTGRTR
jgi:hypothetical protein